jgi:hypothetical protein
MADAAGADPDQDLAGPRLRYRDVRELERRARAPDRAEFIQNHRFHVRTLVLNPNFIIAGTHFPGGNFKIADRKRYGIPGHEPNLRIWYRVPGIPDFTHSLDMIREERILSAISGGTFFN